MEPRAKRAVVVCALAAALACASPQAPTPPRSRDAVVSAAESLIGAPYRYGGRGPMGIDCSGLVHYSYARAGVRGLPRSAEDLEIASTPVELEQIQPGDLLFFRLGRKKTGHVAIYVGDRSFVHAPSGGKRVERVDFDHVYWGPRLARAGRLLD